MWEVQNTFLTNSNFMCEQLENEVHFYQMFRKMLDIILQFKIALVAESRTALAVYLIQKHPLYVSNNSKIA